MTRPLLLAVSVSLLAVLAACDRAGETAPTPPAETPSAPLAPVAEVPAADVLTAEGLGPVRIGMTAAQVASVWGAGPAPDDPSPEGCNEFHPSSAPQGVNVMIQAGRLTRISLIRDATQKTDRGFGLGDTGAAIKAAYGGAIVAEPAKYNPAPAEDLIAWKTGGSTAYVTDPAARGVRYEVGVDGKTTIIHAGDPSIQLVEGCH